MSRISLSHSSGSRAEISVYGAHVLSWTPADGAEALFLSRAAEFRPGAAIRGGIPVVFPQFSSTGPLPKHGFARTRGWTPVVREGEQVTLRLAADAETRALWPHDFVVDLTVTLAAASLTIELEIRNPGDAPFSFTAALHTYLCVADASRATVRGLEGARFRDAKSTAGDPLELDRPPELPIVGPVDRLYVEAPERVELRDPAGGRTIRVAHERFRDLVVWNPWIDGAAAFKDMEDEEYLEMVCVEAAQVERPVELAGGESWRGSQRLEAAAEGER